MDIVIFLAMIFAHIFADFKFQGDFMATYKQKKNWESYVCDKGGKKYENDYIVVLLVHSFSWAFITYLPLLYYECYIYYALLVILQTPIHAYIDHLKCNLLKINLVTDQVLHLVQIVLPFILYKIIF